MIECIVLAGNLFLAGVDINGDNYLVNVDYITHVVEDMTRPDQNTPISLITTTNGTIVEDLTIYDVAEGLMWCERHWSDPYQ